MNAGAGMEVFHLSSDQKEEWNAFVAREPYFSLLQAWEWGEFKEQMGWRVHRIALKHNGDIKVGAQLLVKNVSSRIGSIGYIPRGPIGDWRDPKIATRLFGELIEIAERNRCVFLRIEPHLLNFTGSVDFFESLGFRPSRQTIQPRTTLLIDLEGELDEIWKKFRRKSRQYINSSIRNGVTVRIGSREDLPAYYSLMRESCRRAGIPSRMRAYYENEWNILAEADLAVLLMAFYKDRLLAVRTVCRFGRHAAEFHAGSNSSLPRLYPNHLLVWEAIKWAKDQGCRSYDLWGIPDEIGQMAASDIAASVVERTDGLWGVYRFKSGFSHNVMHFVGAYDYVYRPFAYRLITNRLMNLKIIERIIAFLDLKRRP